MRIIWLVLKIENRVNGKNVKIKSKENKMLRLEKSIKIHIGILSGKV
jgi:hypothetical protein